MPDRDTVINRMETICNMCKEKTWGTEFSSDIIYPLLCDAIALLNEQDNCENCAIAIEDRQPIVRCKDCIHRGDKHKCILAFIAYKQDFPYFFYDNRGEWFCADGERRKVE